MLVVKNLPAYQCRRHKRRRFDPWVRKIRWRGHGNPLQYSCLENPMDRGAWWATVHTVEKTRTRLKQLNTHTHTQHKQLMTDMWISSLNGKAANEGFLNGYSEWDIQFKKIRLDIRPSSSSFAETGDSFLGRIGPVFNLLFAFRLPTH